MASPTAADVARADPTGGAGAVALRRFVAGMQRREFGGRVLGAMLRAGLAVAVPALLTAWWLPSLRGPLLLAAAAVLLPVAAVTAARAHLARRRALLALGRRLADSSSALLLHDELVTWLEVDRRGLAAGRPALLDWLEQDVAARLSAEQRHRLAVATRPTLGRFAWLLPLLLALLLAWWIAELLAPPWPGALGGSPPPGAGGGGQGQGEGDGAGAPQPGDGEPARRGPAG
ncbi:MAG: hypothetical protein H6835_12330 [Planctomycetes bacterium]|nr:hypothetical protein [Planctomycetota bacterium]